MLNKNCYKKTALGAAFLASVLATPIANAGLIISLEETGSDITWTISGSFASLPEPVDDGEEIFLQRVAGFNNSDWLYIGGEFTSVPGREPEDGYAFAYNEFAFQEALNDIATTSQGITQTPTGSFNLGYSPLGIALDENYVLGSTFSSTDVIENQSFSSIGLSVGTFSTTLAGSTETFEVRVGTGAGSGGGASNAVLEPATTSMALLGITGIAWWGRRRRLG